MNIIMTSTDANILNENSSSAKRMISYGTIVDSLLVVIAGVGKREEVALSERVKVVYAGGLNKRDGFSNMIMECRRIIEKNTIDLISAQDPFFVGLATHTARRGYNIPLQVQIHSDIFNFAYIFEKPRRLIEILVSFFVLRKASCVRLVSKRMERAVRMITNAPISILPIHTPHSTYTRQYERPNEFPEGKVVFVASRLMPEKRVDMVIDALAEIPDVSLVIAGSGEKEEALCRRAEKRKIKDRVRFIGWQESLEPFFAHANVFVQMSRYEGFGMSLLEATLAKCPVIATNAGLAGDVFKDTEHITLVSGSVPSLQSALEKHFSNEEEAQSRAERAQLIARGICVTEEEYLAQYKKSLMMCVKI